MPSPLNPNVPKPTVIVVLRGEAFRSTTDSVGMCCEGVHIAQGQALRSARQHLVLPARRLGYRAVIAVDAVCTSDRTNELVALAKRTGVARARISPRACASQSDGVRDTLAWLRTTPYGSCALLLTRIDIIWRCDMPLVAPPIERASCFVRPYSRDARANGWWMNDAYVWVDARARPLFDRALAQYALALPGAVALHRLIDCGCIGRTNIRWLNRRRGVPSPPFAPALCSLVGPTERSWQPEVCAKTARSQRSPETAESKWRAPTATDTNGAGECTGTTTPTMCAARANTRKRSCASAPWRNATRARV